MNIAPNQQVQQAHQMFLYDRALHPELFTLQERRVVEHAAYEVEAWLLEGGHAVRFARGTGCVSEAVVVDASPLPESGVISSFAAAGERDFDRKFEAFGVNYLTTVQTEQLGDNLFRSTLDEMRDYAREVGAMRHEWTDEHGKNLSAVELLRFSREAHVQSYHLLAKGGLVLRTQTIFEQI